MRVSLSPKSSVDTYIQSGKHLPRCLRDFHDAKTVFKGLYDWWKPSPPVTPLEQMGIQGISWIQAHCFVIDIFLRFMAIHGYTLQRSRADIDFLDLDTTLGTTQRTRRLPMRGADMETKVTYRCEERAVKLGES